jgi:hypothetical protein
MRGTGFGFGPWQQSRTEGSGAVSEDPVIAEPITDITLSADTIEEGSAVNTTVGTLAGVSEDETNTYTFEIVGGDSVNFKLVGTAIKVARLFSFEELDSATVIVRGRDKNNVAVEKTFAITVTPVAVPVPVNITPPSIPTTVPSLENEIVATPGVWPENVTVERVWQWDATTINPDETGLIYAIDTFDVGRTLRIGERGSYPNGAWSDYVWSNTSPTVIEGTGPTIAALAVESFTDTSVTFVFPSADPVIRSQWRIRPTGGSPTAYANFTPSDISGSARSKRATVTAGIAPDTEYNLFQLRHEITPGVWSEVFSATGVPFRTSGISAPTPVAPSFTRDPTFVITPAGAPGVGTVISGDSGILSANPFQTTIDYRYGFRTPAVAVTYSAYSAGAASYTVTSGDVTAKHEIQRWVRATNAYGSVERASAWTQPAAAAPTAPDPTEDPPATETTLRYGPPNRANPRVLLTGNGASNVTFTLSPYQDFEITSATPTVAPTATPTSIIVQSGRNGKVHTFNAGGRRVYHATARGTRYHQGIQWNGQASFEIDPLWVAFTQNEDGAPHRLIIQGCRMIPAPGTWESHGSFFIASASCNSGGTWSITGLAGNGIQSVREPAVGDVIEIIGGDEEDARGRWVQLTSVSASAVGSGRGYTIAGTDVTSPTPSPMAVSTTNARSGIAVEEFKQVGSTITLKVAGMASVSTDRGFLLNRVRKANNDTWHTVCTIYHITNWNAGTRVATLSPRVSSYIPAGDFTLTDVKAVYYDSRGRRTNGLTNHSDCFQGLNHSQPFEARCYGNTFKYVYQIARFNATAKLIDVDNCDMERIDQYDTNYATMFPVEVRSQAWDIANNGSTRGYKVRFNKTKFKAQVWRSFLDSQAADPESYSLIDSGRALAYTGSAATSTGWEAGSKITIWDSTTDADPNWWSGDRVPEGAAYTTEWEYDFPAADGPSTGLTWRVVATGDVRNAAVNTALAEFFVNGPADRDITWTVTASNTGGSRVQIHTFGGFATSALGKGSASLVVGANPFTLTVVSSGPHTVGYTRSYPFNLNIGSNGAITSITAA